MNRVIGSLVVLTALALGCEGEAPRGPDASPADAPLPDAGPTDAPPMDASTPDDAATDAPPDAPDMDVPLADVGLPDGAAGDAAATPCASDRECSAAGLVCDRARARCVECRASGDCGDGGRLCFGGRCAARVPCTTSRTCPGQVCDTALGHCVDCVTDVDCPTAERCVEGSCAPRPPTCRSSRDCSALGLVCDTTLGACVECTVAADCAPGSYCALGGACRPQVCAPGAVECVDAARSRACSSDGARWVETPCAAGETCAGGRCQSRVCTPGAVDCADATTRRTCNADGLGRTTTPCPATERCAAGMCLPTSCTPGAVECANATTRRVCNADGLGATATPCGAREGCAAGRCLLWVCTPGALSCPTATSRGVCSDDGQAVVASACPAGQRCAGGTCGAPACTPGAADCADATTRRVCNPDGMTYAATSCAAAPNATGRCAAGVCTTACDAGFGDCDGSAANGCEVILEGSIAHCGRCGNACPPAPNAFASCGSGACGIVCATGFGDCDRSAANGCEASLNSAAHCGACGLSCASGQVCDRGRCAAGALCEPGRIACGTRCVDVRGDHLNCGACGVVCSSGQVCAFGRCLAQTPCPPGTGNTNVAGDCMLLPTDAFQCNNRGTCGASRVCNYGPAGAGLALAYCDASCAPGLRPCGLECVDVQNSVYHCGACGNACAPNQLCVEGRCVTDPAGCAPGVACGGRCVDVRGDHLNCGACGVVCPAGQVCAFSRCIAQAACPFGTRATGVTGDCMLDTADGYNCDARGRRCGAGLVCNYGMAGGGATAGPYCNATCGPGLRRCGLECANVQNSVYHCGACGNVCAPNQLCVEGRCVTDPTGCAPGVACGVRCVDVRGDHLNCGACGVVCPAGQVCAFSRCIAQAACPFGTRATGVTGDCMLDIADGENCNGGGRRCGTGLVCNYGMAGSSARAFAFCDASCAPGLRQCGRECANVQNSVYHCGACGNVCAPNQLCVEGRCVTDPAGCAPGVACGGRCVDVRGDHLNCGACGVVCPAGQVCAFSQCIAQAACPFGTRATGVTGDCMLDIADGDNCDGRGRRCGTGLVCNYGMAAGSSTAIAFCDASCAPGLRQCGRECVNVQNSVYHCGACGNVCAPNQLCVEGRCVTDPTGCAPGVACGGRCVDVRGDHLNCGACGVVCPAGQVCAFSRCIAQPGCPYGTRSTATLGDCTLEVADGYNCNGGGRRCGTGLVCNYGMSGGGSAAVAFCDASCAPGLRQCGRECVNVQLSVYHCGACGNVCAPNQLCVEGRCSP